MSEIRDVGTGTIWAFLAGAVIGVGVGLLVAPKSGRETRKQLADMAHKAQEKANEFAARVKTRAGDVAAPAEVHHRM